MGRQIIELVQVLVDRIEDAAARQQKDFRHLDEEIERRKAAEKDRDHWRQSRQDAIAAGELMQAEIETLKGAMAADDKRLRDAEQRVWPGMTWGCDSPDKMADAILHLRKQLAEQQAETIDVRRQRNNETDRLNATNVVSVQQREEIAYLRARLDEERSVIVSLREQLDESQARRVVVSNEAANDKLQKIAIHCELRAAQDEIASLRQQLDAAQQQDVDAMRADRDRLQACLSTIKAHVEGMYDIEDLMLPLVQIREAIQTLEAGTAEPAPCPECAEMRGKLAGYVAENTKYTDSLQRQRDSALAQSERLWAFVGKVRTEITRYAMSWASWHSMKKALAELDAQRAPVDETAEGGQ